MDTFAISDLHLCDRGPRDNFAIGGRERRLMAFLEYVHAAGGKLVILGDLFDWWQCNVARSVRAYRDLLDDLCGARWVVGNHDAALGEERSVVIAHPHPCPSGPFQCTIGGRVFYFCHGHEADQYCNSQNPGVGEITAILSGLAEDRNKGPARDGKAVEDQVVGSMEIAVSFWKRLKGHASRRDEMLDAVESYRVEKQADVVVYGHTHEAGRIGNRHYNTGSWCRDRDTFVRIDDFGVVSMFAWTDNGPVPFDCELRADQ